MMSLQFSLIVLLTLPVLISPVQRLLDNQYLQILFIYAKSLEITMAQILRFSVQNTDVERISG
jgi:hypothetical protein